MISTRFVCSADAEAICEIYNYYVAHTSISFEEAEVSAEEMRQRIELISGDFPWLVAEKDGVLIGYAYATKWRVRSAYRFSVESSVYMASSARGLGAGARLYQSLLDELRRRGVHLVIGGIALPNEGSVALHEKMGFKKVAHFAEVGFKNEKWIDVGYWQKNLGNC